MPKCEPGIGAPPAEGPEFKGKGGKDVTLGSIPQSQRVGGASPHHSTNLIPSYQSRRPSHPSGGAPGRWPGQMKSRVRTPGMRFGSCRVGYAHLLLCRCSSWWAEPTLLLLQKHEFACGTGIANPESIEVKPRLNRSPSVIQKAPSDLVTARFKPCCIENRSDDCSAGIIRTGDHMV